MNWVLLLVLCVICLVMIIQIIRNLGPNAWFLFETRDGPKMGRRFNGDWEFRDLTDDEMRSRAKSLSWSFLRSPRN